MVDIFRPPYFQPVSVNGVPLAGAKLYFYQAGTTTDITVYQDVALGTPHAQPVVADASGIFAAIFVNTSTYKIVLKTSADVTVATYDNVNSPSLFDSIYTKGSDIASDATLDLDVATGPFIDITGTTAVTAVTLTSGRQRMARATGAFRLTAGASLVVNGSTTNSYTTTAGDLLLFEGYASSVVRVWVISTWAAGANPYPSGYLDGGVLSNDSGDATNDIGIAVFKARSSDNSANIDLTGAIVKRGDASWAVGTGNGGMDTGSIADGTNYVWGIKRPDTGVVDGLISTSRTSPTMPTNYTLKVLLGYFVRSGGVNGTPVWFGTSGPIGESVGAAVLVGSAVSLTSGVTANVTSISLPAGDWDVFGCVVTVGASSPVINIITSAISTTSATLPTLGTTSAYAQTQFAASATGPGVNNVHSLAPHRLVLTSTTNVYLVSDVVWTTGSVSAYGAMEARRVR